MSLGYSGFGRFSSNEASGLGTNGFEVSLNYITGVPDPNILSDSSDLKLIFKSLLKRDETTREKSIQELLNYTQLHNYELDDDLLIITWCQLYPKLSIDNSKKVRAASHQIQSQFVSSLGKKFAKYLKDTIGCWLSGTFDSDRLVSKSCISSIESTFNSKEKINALWRVFTIQILNYSFQVLVLESKDTLSDSRFIGKDETEAKYLRVVLSSVQLFSQVLLESSSQKFKFDDDCIDLINNFISSERFQDLFSNNDLSIKKSIYQCFKIICSNDKSFDSLDSKTFKHLAKASLKGLKIAKNVNPILYSGIIITILDCLVSVTKYDPSFWTSVKKSEDRLLEILKIGSLNSNPIYYDIFSALLLGLPQDFLPFDDHSKLSPYLQIIRNDVASEKLPDFVSRSWKCYLNIIVKASSLKGSTDESIATMFNEFSESLVKLLDSPRNLNPQLLQTLSRVKELSNSTADILLDINSEFIQNLPSGPIYFTQFEIILKNTRQFITNFVLLLSSNKSDLLDVLFNNAIDSLEDEREEYRLPELAFAILFSMFETKTVPPQEQRKSAEKLVKKLPDYTTDESIEQLLEFLVLFSNLDLLEGVDINEITGLMFGKLYNEKSINNFLDKIKEIQGFNVEKCPVIHDYLSGKLDDMSLQDKSSSDDQIMFRFVTSDILTNLYKNITNDEQFIKFVENSNKYYQNDPFLKFSLENNNFVEKLVKSSSQSGSWSLLSKLEKNISDKEFQIAYVDALRKSLSLQSVDDIHSLIISLGPEFVESFLPEKLFSSLTDYLSPSINSKLAISNPLGSTIYMFELSDETDGYFNDISSTERLFSQGMLYLKLLREYPSLASSSSKLLIDISLTAEIASDFIFLHSSASEDILVDFKNNVYPSFISLFQDVQFEDLVNALVCGTSFEPLGYLLDLLDSLNSTTKFYASRLLVIILEKLVENLSLQGFETINFSKFSKQPLKLALVLLSSNQYLTSKSLDRIRNQSGATLIGLKDSEKIVTVGLENLILLNLFMDLDLDIEIPSSFQIIPAQRFAMILSSLSDWSDCDSAYDEEFIPSRIVLMEFVEKYIKGVYYVCDSNYPQDFITKVVELGYRVCSESLNLVNSDVGESSLAYISLRLFYLIKEYKSQIETWDETVADIFDDIFELFLKQANNKVTSKSTELINEVLSRVLVNTVPIGKVKEHYHALYNFIVSPNFEIQKTSVVLLHTIIPQIQDELVVEATLSKPVEDESDLIRLPSVLVKNVSEIYFDDYLEYQDQSSVNAYLYSWYLILDHFKSITQKIRQDYINDLGEDLIQDFLTFLFKELDLNKLQLGKDDSYVTAYEIPKDQLDKHSENTKLVVHLLYLSMKNFGGNITQTWFNSIRDKQLKQSIEKLLVKNISPILTNEILEGLVGMDSLQDSEFKIKLNKNINEIKCFYEIDEQKLEISIALPPNYPLSQIAVNGITRLGVDEKKWKSWILACQYVINIQNGTIMEAIKHFKNNVKMNFENYDDCAICYSILNAVDHSTPNKVCSTCKHNFHSACLYRWFKSSGSSTCPLCRAKFQFKKHS